jgi:quinolinate synthase
MFRVVEESDREEFIVLTESGMGYPLGRRFPGRRFYFPFAEPLCPDMKVVTLEKVERSLRDMEPRITVPEETRVRALRAVERMLAIG